MANSIHIGGGGSGSATLITKSITQNGTYLAQDDNADGYSSVDVDVAGGGLTPVSLANETHNIETNRTFSISNNTIISTISSGTYCTGVVTIPVSAFTKGEFILEYDIGTPSYSSNQYFARVVFSDTIPASTWITDVGYGYIALTQSTTAWEGLMQRIEIPTGAQYFNIEFGVTNFSSIRLLEEVGGGTSFDTVLTAGQVSTTSDYATANFNDISDYKYLYVKVYDTVNGVDYTDYRGIAVASIPQSGDYYFSVGLHLTVELKITRTSISGVNYSGAWYNIYADIIATNTELFPTT